MKAALAVETCVRDLVVQSRARDEMTNEGTQGPTGIEEYIVLCVGAGHPPGFELMEKSKGIKCTKNCK